MASVLPLSKENFYCPVCCDILKDPVLLFCCHRACEVCLRQFWTNKDIKECPVCRRKLSRRELQSNPVLKNLCEAVLEEKCQKALAGSEELCSLHSEKLKLFCLEDKQPVCVVCQDTKKHKKHNCYPTEEVAFYKKKELKTTLKSLKKKLKDYNKEKRVCSQTTNRIKIQTQHTERQIKEEFEKLHQFLRDEEAARITALREEEEQKRQMMKEKIEEMNLRISSLSDTIRAIKKEMEATDISFLQNFKTTIKRTQCTLQDPQMLSRTLINVTKHLGNLKFKVWEKMQDIVQYGPVTLDPNTAGKHLVLFEDLTSVRYEENQDKLLYDPERFDEYPCVLGSEGFNSGTHCWDVDVGDNTNWALGVITESVQKKGDSVHGGLWCLSLLNGKYKAVPTPPSKTQLSVAKKIQRIRVELDWDRGKLSFSDPLNNTHLHTFTHTFTERIFPLFCFKCKRSPLRILPVRIVLLYDSRLDL
ncbi:E3 ubiquitin-protein ligase TRIM39-like [Chanos chanos]|uniref:E3 ubiquitin-protein ligase TRIM39-like n=1 Tax=Chanos chanos TaxID=29144 RepID=A0A6J2WD26_CHACN|nr:E3 ubiquitin-protein ligase TRIM39-like [Chanos chanos]